MNRYILRFAFFAVLFAFATSAHAQSNCSTPNQSVPYNYYQNPPGIVNASTFPNVDICSGNSEDKAYTVTVNQSAWCTNTNNNTTYASSTRQVLGNGVAHCSNFTSLDLLCNPRFDYSTTTATSPTDYNRFYLRAYDGYGYCKSDIFSRQDFWQCLGVACSSSNFGCFWPCTTPIIIDVGGHGYALTDAKEGVMFDFLGDGNPVRTAWTSPGAENAFLVLPEADGLVHNGSQLFGNLTPQPPTNDPNGFAALAVYDLPANGGNGDGVIGGRDAIFASLRLWVDANHDGISQPNELFTLLSLGVNSISLTYKLNQRTDQNGNVFRYFAQINPGTASNGGRIAYDVIFANSNPSAKKNAPSCPVPVPAKAMLASTGRL